jgi:hypothetical protein
MINSAKYLSPVRTLILAGLVAGLVSGCSRPQSLQDGFGLEITATGIGVTGGANSITQFYGYGCEKALASFGHQRKPITEVAIGMTSCDLYRLKGHPVRTSSLSLFQDEGEIPNWFDMFYVEDGQEVKYTFHANLLEKVE